MKSKIMTLILGLLLVSVVSIVLAAKPGQEANDTTKGPQKNMTFMQCVSDAAAVKNTCYKTVKDALAACRTDAANQTDSKAAFKQCKADYKKDKKQCKADFKSKRNECKKIKHSYLDSIRAAFIF